MSRSGFGSIRCLIAQRRTSLEINDGNNEAFSQQDMDYHQAAGQQKPRSAARKTIKKNRKLTNTAVRQHDNAYKANIASTRPLTPRSSTGSLSRFDGHGAELVTPSNSPRRLEDRGRHKSPVIGTSGHGGGRPPPSPAQTPERRGSPKLQAPVSDRPLEPSVRSPSVLNPFPTCQDGTGTRVEMAVVVDGRSEALSDKLDQRLGETREAPQLGETDFRGTLPPLERLKKLDKFSGQEQRKRIASRKKSQGMDSPRGVLTRSAPARRTKKADSKKLGREPRSIIRQMESSTGWTAKDLFPIRFFNRVEADEMLPESTLQEIRMSRANKATRKKAQEEVDSAKSPAGPFHLEDLASRLKRQPTTKGHGTVKAFERPSSSHDPNVSAHVTGHNESLSATAMDAIHQPTDRLPLLSESQKDRGHRRLSGKYLPPLPIIPEIITTAAGDTVFSPSSVKPVDEFRVTVGQENYIFLESTRFTATVPGFRHGPIRLTKADLAVGKFVATLDDTLDWTAFQMAILGGAGDFLDESTDFSRPSDAELQELDQLAAWFDEFGFDGPGALIGDDRPATPTPGLVLSNRSLESTPSSLNSIPRSLDRRNQAKMRTFDYPIPVEDTTGSPAGSSSPFFFPGHNLQQDLKGSRWTGTATDVSASKRPDRRHGSDVRTGKHLGLAIDAQKRISNESTSSPAQSPMLDLVVSKDVNGQEYVIPMGFNLDHDLGDFLKWESENVFNVGYFGPDMD